MASFTLKGYVKELEQRAKDLSDSRPFFEIAAFTHRAQVKRIFDLKKNSQGGIIGEYSTKPIYVDPRDSPRSIGRPIGKSKKSKFKDGTDHKSRYFPGGYKEFKQKVRGSTTVDLFLFSIFSKSYRGGLRPVNTTIPIKRFQTVVTATAGNPEGKIEGLTERYELAFKLSKNEKEQHLKKTRALVLKILS